jgi:hypothetical protein
MVDYAAVLTAIRPNSLWSMVNNDYSTLDWQSDDPKPTKKTLDDAWPQVQYEREFARIKAERRARYAAETDGLYFEAMRGDGNLDAWNAATAAIRADLPYPEAPEPVE